MYEPMSATAERIRDLVDRKRYRNERAVIDRALDILLAWESDRPEETIRIMQTLMPFTPQQEAFIDEVMKEDERKKHFGEAPADEAGRHKALTTSNLDHKRVRDNLAEAQEYMRGWSPPELRGAFEYDGYPMLFKLYSRFLPVKITVSVLGNMLYEDQVAAVGLDRLRGGAYDIAEEIAGQLVVADQSKKVRRNMKMSTGLPTKAQGRDVEKTVHAQKRFKDQYVGAVRRHRTTKTRHADGALAALGLASIFEEGGELRVTLTEAGRQFFLLDNPVMRGEYVSGRAIGDEEAAFILGSLIPSLPLEDMFVKAAVGTVKRAGRKAGGAGASTADLDRAFFREVVRYAEKSQKVASRFGLDKLGGTGKGLSNEKTRALIVGWRVATMGRLAELGAVEWKVGAKGESVYLPAG